MTIEIVKDIFPFQSKDFFFAIRSKPDFVRLILNVAKYVLIDVAVDNIQPIGQVHITIDKMRRLFIFQEGKFFSVVFPFILSTNKDGEYELRTLHGLMVDSRAISFANEILEDESFKMYSSLSDFLKNLDSESTRFSRLIGVTLLEELMQVEPSYIRYDFDEDRADPVFHPMHHLDVNYNDSGSFKLGFHDAILPDQFKELIDNTKSCNYIEKQ